MQTQIYTSSHDHVIQLSDIDYTSDEEIDRKILAEKHESITQLNQDLEDLAEIQKHMNQLIYTQGEQLDHTHRNIKDTEQDTEQATENIQKAETISNKIRGLFKKGIFISTGVTGLSAAGMIINPLAGGIGVIMGLGGIIACAVQMKRQ